MSDILTMIFPLFGLIFLGFGAGKIRSLPIEGMAWLNLFIVYLALPALFFQMLSTTPMEQLTNWSFIFATTLSAYIVFALSFGIGAFASKGDISESTIQGLAGAYGNIGFMGPGIAIAALGPEAAVPVALIFCFENAMHFTIAPLMMAIDNGNGTSRWKILWSVFVSIITHPFIVATILGITAAAFQFQAPEAVDKLLSSISAAAAPCALFAIGVSIALRPVGRLPAVFSLLVAMKLVIHPIIAYVVVSWIGDFSATWTYAAVILASLPTATNVYVIAEQNKVWLDKASSMIVISTVLSVFTVSGLLYLIANGILPPDLFPGN
jgi:predicted permease